MRVLTVSVFILILLFGFIVPVLGTTVYTNYVPETYYVYCTTVFMNDSYYLRDGSLILTGRLDAGGYNLSNITTVSLTDAVNVSYLNSAISASDVWNLSYYLRDTTRSLTGQNIVRNVNNDVLTLTGGTGGLPYGAQLQMYGGANVAQAGGAIFSVGDFAGAGAKVVWSVLGTTNTPELSMNNNKIVDLKDPTAAQDAMTLNYFNTHGGGGGGASDSWNISYYLRDTSRSLTGNSINRDVDNSYLGIHGGTGGDGTGSHIFLFGNSHIGYPGNITFTLPDKTSATTLETMKIAATDNAPYLDMRGNNITGIRRIDSGEDAVNLSMLNAVNATIAANLSNFAYLPGRTGGQVLNGGIANNENLTLNATTNGVGNVLINPITGYVGVGNFSGSSNKIPISLLEVINKDDILARFGDGSGISEIDIGNPAVSYNTQLGYDINNNTGYLNAIGADETTAADYLFIGGYDRYKAPVSIRATGNVAIGGIIRAASTTLHVLSTGTQNARVESFDNAATLGIKANNSGGVNWLIQSGLPFDGAFNIRQEGVINALTINKTTGYVGILTNLLLPSQPLDVNGMIRSRNLSAGSLQSDAGGNITTVSDERQKNNIQPFTKGLVYATNLTPIEFNYSATSGLDTAHKYYGFSAQNINATAPELVYTNPQGYLSFSDRGLLAVIINSIKELSGKTTLGSTVPSSPYTVIVSKENGNVYAKDSYGKVLINQSDGGDDSLVIQGAINNCSSTGGTVYIKNGTYSLGAPNDVYVPG